MSFMGPMIRMGDLIVWIALRQQKVFLLPRHFNRSNYKGGERLRKLIVLISMLILWASAAYGANSGGSANIDIMGSLADNTSFITPEGMPVVLDIVGSTTTNIQVSNPVEEGR